MLSANKGLEVVNVLRATGVGSVVSLPQVVVVGDTSSAKSSLLSQLTGIPFPSGNDVTTLCPVEIKMKPAAKFRCVVGYRRVGGDEVKNDVDKLDGVTAAIEAAMGDLAQGAGMIVEDTDDVNLNRV